MAAGLIRLLKNSFSSRHNALLPMYPPLPSLHWSLATCAYVMSEL